MYMDMKKLISGIFLTAIAGNTHAFECPPGAPNICAPATVIDFTVERLISTVAPGDAPLEQEGPQPTPPVTRMNLAHYSGLICLRRMGRP